MTGDGKNSLQVYSSYKSHISEIRTSRKKRSTELIGGGPEEAISVLSAIVNSRKQEEFTASVNGILLHSSCCNPHRDR